MPGKPARSTQQAARAAAPGALPQVLLLAPRAQQPTLKRSLAEQGLAVTTQEPTARLPRASLADADIVLVAEGASRGATLALLRRLEKSAPATRRMVLAARGDEKALLAYLNEGGAHHVLRAPATGRRLSQAVRQLHAQSQREHAAKVQGEAAAEALAGLQRGIEQRSRELSRANRELRTALREIARKNKALTALNESLRIQSSTDALTGLYNRREFLTRIRTEWGRFKRYGRPLSLIMLDIDRFKSINDTHGHECGDVVLRTLGQLIGRARRAQDVCCRYGGEEFVVLLTETTLDTAFHVAETLRRRVEAYRFDYGGVAIPVHVSLGVAGAFEQAPPGFEAFINAADKAMYRAKREGRNRTVVLSAKDERRIERQTEPAALAAAAGKAKAGKAKAAKAGRAGARKRPRTS